MGHTLLCVLDLFCSMKASVILEEGWTEIFFGERITLRCDIQGAEGTQWTYDWRRDKSNLYSTDSKFNTVYGSDSGKYSCRGRSNKLTTEWSEAIRWTVSDRPRASLRADKTVIPAGGSITLTCSVDVSSGWKYYWNRRTSVYSGVQPINDQSDTVSVSEKFVWSAVNPDRVQHFTSESVSLTCEGNSAEWRVRKFSDEGHLPSCSNWRTMTGSTCNIKSTSHSDIGVYWCESASGEFSNTVNITVHDTDIVLVSPVHPVTEGDSVILGCRLRGQNKLSNVFFYHNNKRVQSDTRGELNISAVSESHEGFYRCEHSGKKSPQSWMSVTFVSMRQSEELKALEMTTAHAGSRGERLWDNKGGSGCESRPQSDVSVYETIKEPENTEHGESSDVAYSLIQLKNVTKKGKKQKPVESCVYSDVKIRSSAGTRRYNNC
ncbi:Fc receptor-like protein 5 [Parambassis ranga]|uniref:Fc receptor-like protein 5 n=1 Tax=Parambassis ranga TaxID=210632 RepID=A0A6P7I888_9TELE|nr:Fc receptor-like protein 5 [Parambassis ranga]